MTSQASLAVTTRGVSSKSKSEGRGGGCGCCDAHARYTSYCCGPSIPQFSHSLAESRFSRFCRFLFFLFSGPGKEYQVKGRSLDGWVAFCGALSVLLNRVEYGGGQAKAGLDVHSLSPVGSSGLQWAPVGSSRSVGRQESQKVSKHRPRTQRVKSLQRCSHGPWSIQEDVNVECTVCGS